MNWSEELRQFIISTFLSGDGASLQDDTSFLESGIIDSTGMMELIAFLENSRGIKIEPEEMVPANLDSVNRILQFMARKTTNPEA